MIVECSNCQTRFQLDDSRVPLRGIRVRCSRCKEAFFLEHPNASQAEAAHDVAEHAAGSVGPDTTQDLSSEASITNAPSHTEPDDEEDWEFNDEPLGLDPNETGNTQLVDPESDPLATAAAEADEDVADSADGDLHVPGLGFDERADGAESGLELDVGSSSDLAGSADVACDADDRSSSDLAGSPDVACDADDREEESAFGEVSDFSALADEKEESHEQAEAIPAPPAAALLSSDDVGEPEDWDFFSDESLEQPDTFETMDDAMGSAMAAVEADDPSRVSGSASSGPDLGHVRAETSWRSGLRKVGHALGWIVTLGLLSLGLARGVFQLPSPGTRTNASVDLGDFQAVQIRGSWFETVRSTRLYAVTGQLVNDSDQARWPGSGLSVALLSPDGRVLELPAARAGVPIPEAQLRELSPDDLARAVDQSVAALAWVRLEPGQAATFQAFFDGVPDEATSFMLELADAPAPPALAPEVSPVLEQLETLPGIQGDLAPAFEGDATTGASPAQPPSSGSPAAPAALSPH